MVKFHPLSSRLFIPASIDFVCSESKILGRARLLVGQASAARMPPSSLHGRIHGVLSGKQPQLGRLLSWAGAMHWFHDR